MKLKIESIGNQWFWYEHFIPYLITKDVITNYDKAVFIFL